MAQACHAVIQYQLDHPDSIKEWFTASNYIAVVSTEDEPSLMVLYHKCIEKDIKVSFFLEPDLNDQMTAIVIQPGQQSKKLCGKLKLALAG